MPLDASTAFSLTTKQEEQRRAAASAATHILGFGGSRSGKTFGFCRCVAARSIIAPGSRHLIARLHNIDVRQSVMMDTWPTMMKLCFPKVEYTVNKTDQFASIHTNNGDDAEVWFGGLDDKDRVEKILGKEYVTVYPNETSQISYGTILTLRTRLAQKVFKLDGRQMALKAYYDLNPVGRTHWSYLEFIKGVRPDNQAINFKRGSRAVVQMNPIDNPHLPDGYMEELDSLPERQKQRFRDGEYLSEVPGSLWSLDGLEQTRVIKAPEIRRIVVAIDPSGSNGAGGDSQGIIVAGKGIDGGFYVLEDITCNLSPAGWARRAVDAYDRWGADCIVAEINYGGAMVESAIRTASKTAKYKGVTASRGKHIRAEPVAALFEPRKDGAGKVLEPAQAHIVGYMPELEEQLTSFTLEGYQGSGSPDRADAMVWAASELMFGKEVSAGVLLKKRNRK